jgi:hypothetical protein
MLQVERKGLKLISIASQTFTFIKELLFLSPILPCKACLDLLSPEETAPLYALDGFAGVFVGCGPDGLMSMSEAAWPRTSFGTMGFPVENDTFPTIS